MLKSFSAPTVVGGPWPGIKIVSSCCERIFSFMFLIKACSENLLFDESVVFPLFHNVSVNIIDLEEIKGWSNNAFDFHPIKYIKKEPVIKQLPNIAKNN